MGDAFDSFGETCTFIVLDESEWMMDNLAKSQNFELRLYTLQKWRWQELARNVIEKTWTLRNLTLLNAECFLGYPTKLLFDGKGPGAWTQLDLTTLWLDSFSRCLISTNHSAKISRPVIMMYRCIFIYVENFAQMPERWFSRAPKVEMLNRTVTCDLVRDGKRKLSVEMRSLSRRAWNVSKRERPNFSTLICMSCRSGRNRAQ